ncbi:MAG: TetR/AcrR family transcriptional regulator [Rhodococcus sp. (in: high G+C Gram-positive bacteria)]|uniref:TetR/AcrR family transcriptional regulator n=1 Tax=Rhodococcus sp. EPR-157 TaxID=1813677 RepID=UPI0007BC5D2D|nr:TetR/AcrR family transcriptional regulator [Rhodococcus sp. EPR-157]KZF12648.1 hypothetical protein A2J03_17475 [Rhodococcus sp. EPR-157]
MPTEPAESSRRDRIADAVIDVLGRHGSRGLTHRAVDRQAGLSSSSTSYYCPTRAELVKLGAERLAARDGEMIAALFDATPATPQGLLASILCAWLSGDTLVLTRARLELFLLGRSDPELAQTLRSIRANFVELAAMITIDKANAEFLVAALDGIVLAECCLGDGDVSMVRAEQLVVPLESFLRASL